MYLMYVDESGDSGLNNSLCSYFALSGLVIHEGQWRDFVTQMKAFRGTLKAVYGLPLRTELHASEFLRKAPIPGLSRHQRLSILRNLLDELARMSFLSITNIIVDKTNKPHGYDVFSNAWKTLFQRFENTLKFGNFPGGFRNDFGLVITDATEGEKLKRLMRKMYVYNPIPNQLSYGSGARNLPLLRVIEDPFSKDSEDSYFIQACDSVAYFLLQSARPNGFVKRHSAQNYFRRLRPVLNLRASSNDPLGVVRL